MGLNDLEFGRMVRQLRMVIMCQDAAATANAARFIFISAVVLVVNASVNDAKRRLSGTNVAAAIAAAQLPTTTTTNNNNVHQSLLLLMMMTVVCCVGMFVIGRWWGRIFLLRLAMAQ